MATNRVHRLAFAGLAIGLVLTVVAACTSGGDETGGGAAARSSGSGPSSRPSSASTVSVTITGGLETAAGDNGRPIVLVAGLLAVPPQVFRQAFSGVTPADPDQGPTVAEAQHNKAALLAVLGPYGLTNDQIDAASNTYRYNESAGQLWPHTSATATAVVANGIVTAIKVTSGGSGYTSPPTITLSNGQTATATLSYGQVAATNGSITAITLN